MWINRSKKYAGHLTIWQTEVGRFRHRLIRNDGLSRWAFYQIALKSDGAVETALPHDTTEIVKGESEFVESASIREKS